MDLGTPIGFSVGMIGLIGAFVLEGGNPLHLIEVTAFMIVAGGSLGALLVSFPMEVVLAMPKVAMGTLKKPESDMQGLIVKIINFAETARREGLLALESMVDNKEAGYPPMLKRGIQLIVDGTDPEYVKNLLELEVHMTDQKINAEAEPFAAAGGFLPTMGVLGTVMGLVNVLGNLTNPDELGGSVAVAFVATLYGVGFANVIFLPLSNKIKHNGKVGKMEKLLIIEGVLSIQAGENPRLIQEKLETFLIVHGGKKAAAAEEAPAKE